MSKFYFQIKLFLVIGYLKYIVSSEKQPTIATPLGEIKGYYLKTRGGRQISAFTAIPFAKPPLENLRFKAPIAVLPWTETLIATKPSPLCVQRNPYVRQIDIEGQEDCLYLNIYTPHTNNDLLPEKNLLPVMVWFHGGGWMCGGSVMYGPDYLLDRDIVLVTTNYRLGPLGFLSTQDEHCPGNNGLKDQQEALRFVQKVIHSFGGNKNSVTIFGESAGGASVHYHMMSETSAGLFHKAISESGTALVPWAEAPPGEALRNTFRLAKLLDCPQAPSDKMLTCLRARNSYDIINTEYRFYVWDYEPLTPFKAVVEPDLSGAFLTKNPRHPTPPSVPWLTGLTRDEGCVKSVWITSNTTRLKEFMAGFDTIAPVTFYYENSPYADVITKRIRNKYLKGLSPEEIKSGILDIYTDSNFAYPLIEAVELALNYTRKPVFLYELTYKASNSFTAIFGDPEENSYVCHADDLLHLFPIVFHRDPTTKDLEISKLIITMWTNFAVSGNPNKPEKLPAVWERATSSQNMEYFEIGDDLVMKGDLASRSRFWSTLPLWHNIRSRTFVDEL
ncbi:venom carboxylesterase-6-like isoform X2 [Hyposmocoma kahamanoa]|uniref:venom carboxylesterase-6-like isoform X2 n=1 Tax=Hyposmocoma kahamanoa TaxID=1477025 RepID=UPI000E6D6945|nr:venom carboxylesterase-6-like isoform X2 [Hyposmocoma kahamanoa]